MFIYRRQTRRAAGQRSERLNVHIGVKRGGVQGRSEGSYVGGNRGKVQGRSQGSYVGGNRGKVQGRSQGIRSRLI